MAVLLNAAVDLHEGTIAVFWLNSHGVVATLLGLFPFVLLTQRIAFGEPGFQAERVEVKSPVGVPDNLFGRTNLIEAIEDTQEGPKVLGICLQAAGVVPQSNGRLIGIHETQTNVVSNKRVVALKGHLAVLDCTLKVTFLRQRSRLEDTMHDIVLVKDRFEEQKAPVWVVNVKRIFGLERNGNEIVRMQLARETKHLLLFLHTTFFRVVMEDVLQFDRVEIEGLAGSLALLVLDDYVRFGSHAFLLLRIYLTMNQITTNASTARMLMDNS